MEVLQSRDERTTKKNGVESTLPLVCIRTVLHDSDRLLPRPTIACSAAQHGNMYTRGPAATSEAMRTRTFFARHLSSAARSTASIGQLEERCWVKQVCICLSYCAHFAPPPTPEGGPTLKQRIARSNLWAPSRHCFPLPRDLPVLGSRFSFCFCIGRPPHHTPHTHDVCASHPSPQDPGKKYMCRRDIEPCLTKGPLG